MNKRDYKMFLEDMLHSIDKIQRFTQGMSFQDFEQNELVFDAVIRNLEIIGEATRHIPDHFEQANPQIPWRQMSGFRNILIHEYFGVDEEIVWEVVSKELPRIRPEIEKLIIG